MSLAERPRARMGSTTRGFRQCESAALLKVAANGNIPRPTGIEACRGAKRTGPRRSEVQDRSTGQRGSTHTKADVRPSPRRARIRDESRVLRDIRVRTADARRADALGVVIVCQGLEAEANAHNRCSEPDAAQNQR